MLNYLMGKSDELKDMRLRDLMLAKVVMDIHRKQISKTVQRVPLAQIYPIHPVDRDNALASLNKRIAVLEKNDSLLQAQSCIDFAFLSQFLPSVSWIKVVQVEEDRYVSFEGNGRIEALKKVLSDTSVPVEVEGYEFDENEKIRRRIQRVQRMNGAL